MRRSQNALSFLALPVLDLFAAAIFLGNTASGAAAAESKRVLLLHSFGPRFKPWSDYAKTIRSEINRQSRKSVDFVDQSLVNARVSDVQSEAPFVDYLSALYAGHPLDLIIAFGGPAATFVLRPAASSAPLSKGTYGRYGRRPPPGPIPKIDRERRCRAGYE